MEKQFTVIKANGYQEPFNEIKVRLALSRSQILGKHQDRVIENLMTHLHDKISTHEIERIIIEILKEIYPTRLGRYRLKEAIMSLGPTGFPFEQFVGRLLRNYQYNAEIDVTLYGKCVSHEIDVLANKDNKQYFVECKYHNQHGNRTDVKTVLYVKARGDDLRSRIQAEKPDSNILTYQPWIFTNTKFSQDAITYAQCENISLTGWNYPQEANLQSMIEEKKLYPLTCLMNLDFVDRKKLLNQKIVLASEVKDPAVLKELNLENFKKISLLNEIEELTNSI